MKLLFLEQNMAMDKVNYVLIIKDDLIHISLDLHQIWEAYMHL